MITLCRKCNQEVRMLNTEIVSKSRSKTILKGYCSICGNEVFSQIERELNNNLETCKKCGIIFGSDLSEENSECLPCLKKDNLKCGRSKN